MRRHLELVQAAVTARPTGLERLRAIAETTVRFGADHQALAQLLFFPAVPGFEPSPQAYRPSLEVQRMVTETVAAAVAEGDLHPAAATGNGLALFIAVTAGVGSLQRGNDQYATAENARYVPLIAPALDMFVDYFSPAKPPDWRP
jgi:hypothetical protein